MPFIRKRMECYVDENENKFLKAQKTLNIFGNLEEIQTVEDNIGGDQKENKKEIRIIDNLEENHKVEDNKEEIREKIVDINNNIAKIKEEKEDIKEDNNNKDDKKKEKRTRFNLTEEEIIQKKKENKNKKAKKAAYEFIKQLMNIKNLIKK
jgi:hypothetical protein